MGLVIKRLVGFRFFLAVGVAVVTIWVAVGAEEKPLVLARVQYYGGDYYTDPTSLPNLAGFASDRTAGAWEALDGSVSLLDPNLNAYPILYLTGHVEIHLQDDEVEALSNYLHKGGFLIVNDNGPKISGNSIDESFRREIARVLPENQLVELTEDHPIYNIHFPFPRGLPQIHRHDENLPPMGFGIYVGGRLAVFYAWNSDIGNGWEDIEVHNTPTDKHEAALKMGTNILMYALYQ